MNRKTLRCEILKYVRNISVFAEATPNPNAMMFWLENGKEILGEGVKSMSFTDKYQSNESPLANSIFKINGVDSVLLTQRRITVGKSPHIDWNFLQPSVELVLSQFFETEIPVVNPALLEQIDKSEFKDSDEVEKKIKSLIEERVRPFVQRDGGDVKFLSFEPIEGVLSLSMQGSCSGCPKSAVTLKVGIQRLMRHYVPEVKQVINIEPEASEDEDEKSEESELEEDRAQPDK